MSVVLDGVVINNQSLDVSICGMALNEIIYGKLDNPLS